MRRESSCPLSQIACHVRYPWKHCQPYCRLCQFWCQYPESICRILLYPLIFETRFLANSSSLYYRIFCRWRGRGRHAALNTKRHDPHRPPVGVRRPASCELGPFLGRAALGSARGEPVCGARAIVGCKYRTKIQIKSTTRSGSPRACGSTCGTLASGFRAATPWSVSASRARTTRTAATTESTSTPGHSWPPR
jgi:hypothetical protein